LSRAQLDQAGLAQFPSAIGGVVLMVNIPGVSSETLKLDAPTLAAIFVGSVKKWNDPALRALNPDLALPALPIVPVYRSEGSGTSYVLTTYLSKLSPQFKSTFGVTSNFIVPSGKSGKTSADVAKVVRETAGAIGYFDYAYAVDLGLPTVQMKNQWGKFVSANRESLQVAMRAADWEKMLIDQDPTFELDLTDAGCPACWPIATATYVLVPIKGRNSNSFRVLEFFEQALQHGDESATKEGYVPLPSRAKNIVAVAMRRWQAALEKSGAGKPQRRSQDGTAAAVGVALL
jgi:phosphate transport system substrate-binding protein